MSKQLNIIQEQAFLESESILNDNLFSYTLFPFKNKLSPTEIDNTATLLGKRMEVFFHHYLTYHEQYEIINHSIQLIDNKVTIGELDFIVKNEERFLHIELAYKFYLFDPSILSKDNMGKWIGPNRNDSLVKKLTKLKEKQFPLLYSKEGKAFLNNHHISIDSVDQELLLLGKLYLPYNYKEHNWMLNKACFDGLWMRFNLFKHIEHVDVEFFIPRKFNWHINPTHHNIWLSKEHILVQINEQMMAKKSVLVWLKQNDKYEKLFIVWW